MLIIQNYNTNFKANLIPKSEYKGIILKLTKADKEKIHALQTKKAEIELDLSCIQKHINKIKITTPESIRLQDKYFTLEERIHEIENMIKKIKIDRLNKQKK